MMKNLNSDFVVGFVDTNLSIALVYIPFLDDWEFYLAPWFDAYLGQDDLDNKFYDEVRSYD